MKPKNITSLSVLAIAMSLAPFIRASNIPDVVLPEGVGVNIHFVGGHERDLDLIAAAGFKWVREDFFWGGIERRKGEYDWSDYDDLVAELDQRGMHAYFILDYSNPLYEGDVTVTNPVTHVLEEHSTASPQHPESIEAFANWAAAAAKHFHGRGVIWEIWNEPNIGFWKPRPDADQYAALALAACRAIRKADPEATIVGPASSGFDWKFLETVFKAGLLEYLDGVSVHPYRPPTRPPETAAVDYRRLRALIEKYAPPGKRDMPIISGEWGYSSNTRGVSLEQQANFIARQQLSNLLNGVPVSIWYDWKNDGNDPAENEHNFGTVTSDLSPKPAYTAIQTLTRELAGCHLAGRFDNGHTNDFLLIFSKDGHQAKLVAWTTTEPNHLAPISFNNTSTNPITWVDGSGKSETAIPLGTTQTQTGHRFTHLVLTGTPKYADLHGDEVPLQ